MSFDTHHISLTKKQIAKMKGGILITDAEFNRLVAALKTGLTPLQYKLLQGLGTMLQPMEFVSIAASTANVSYIDAENWAAITDFIKTYITNDGFRAILALNLNFRSI